MRETQRQNDTVGKKGVSTTDIIAKAIKAFERSDGHSFEKIRKYELDPLYLQTIDKYAYRQPKTDGETVKEKFMKELNTHESGFVSTEVVELDDDKMIPKDAFRSTPMDFKQYDPNAYKQQLMKESRLNQDQDKEFLKLYSKYDIGKSDRDDMVEKKFKKSRRR